jgi:hypothetical protein
MRDRPAADRRRLAAKVYSVSVERFRKSQEAAGTTADRDVHLVVRRPLIADLVADVLGAEQQPLTAAELPSGEERGHRCG